MKRVAPKAKKAPAKKAPLKKEAVRKEPVRKEAARKPAPKKAAIKKPALAKVPELQDIILDILDGDKAQEIVLIPLKGKTAIADYMVIATGTSSRHVGGMATKLREKLNAEYKIKARIEGADTGDWVIVDAGDVMVHLFREEVRRFYDLEKLWGADFSTVHYTSYQ